MGVLLLCVGYAKYLLTKCELLTLYFLPKIKHKNLIEMGILFSTETVRSLNKRQKLAMLTAVKAISDNATNSTKRLNQQKILTKYLLIFELTDVAMLNYEQHLLRIDLRSLNPNQRDYFIVIGHELLGSIQDRRLEDYNILFEAFQSYGNISSSEFSGTIERLRGNCY